MTGKGGNRGKKQLEIDGLAAHIRTLIESGGVGVGGSETRTPCINCSLMQSTNGGVATSPATSADADKATSIVELPLHLTEKILCHVSPLESARHATVCKSWAATVSARLAKPVPALFVCTPPDNKSDRRGFVGSVSLDAGPDACSPASTATAIRSGVRSSDTNGLQCIGATPSGLVAFAGSWWGRNVILVNPITGLLHNIDDIAYPHPHLDPRHCLVLTAGGDSLFAVDEGYKLTIWRRQADGGEEAWSSRAVTATWATWHATTNHILYAVNCNGCFYLLHADGCLSKVDTTSSSSPQQPLRVEKLRVESLRHKLGALFSIKDDSRLLESDGEVLFVRQLLLDDSRTFTLPVFGFEVYRLDVKEQRWRKVDRLPHDRALFVSAGSSFAVRASEVEGCRSNCIYFVGKKRYCYSGEDSETSWGMYSMEHRRILFEHRVTEPGRSADVLWFLPRLV
ncbi:hypothetical protein QOZ80_2AG0108830 [Eleusine coracana subsp. coracana]|nr:hypothetical protein QOZ80_2AG0108830 [Eleusine coracana subsp. coracana]